MLNGVVFSQRTIQPCTTNLKGLVCNPTVAIKYVLLVFLVVVYILFVSSIGSVGREGRCVPAAVAVRNGGEVCRG
jgi:hypothetical protein